MQNNHRIPHIMKRHTSNRMPASLLFFDTETKTDESAGIPRTERQRLHFGWAYAYRYEDGSKTREEWCRFEDSKTFFDFLTSKTDNKRPVYCFAHNLGFDLTILDFWNWSETEDFTVEYFVLQDPPSFIIGRHKGRKIVFIDTLNYWRQSLLVIGRSIGLDKLEMPKKTASKAKWDAYGKRDVEILDLAVTKLMEYVKVNDLGQFGLSAASMAFSTYKHRFMKHDIYIHDNRLALTTERTAYYGGYTDCLYVGKLPKRKVYKLDVNSMYPFVMLNTFPVKLLRSTNQTTIGELRHTMRSKAIISRVTIDSNRHLYPSYVEGRLCYCRGHFDTTLCGPELKRALYNGNISKVHTLCVYDSAPIFRDYINFFWKERQRFKAEGNDVNQYFVKLFMNMLYGKFGQMGYDSAVLTPEALESIYIRNKQVMPEAYRNPEILLREFLSEIDWTPMGLTHSVTLRRINNLVHIKVPNGEHSESFPGIAAYVTSYARELLLSFLSIAGDRNTYYCDTDSLFCNEIGYRNLEKRGCISPGELGKLKLEGVSNGAEFWCPKDYCFNDKATRKGIREAAKEIRPNVFEQLQFEGIKSVLKRGYEPFIDVRTITKTNSRNYNKGSIGKGGWVIPFTLPLDVNPASDPVPID
jgi:DNA polymerase type B, organellar and viral